MKYRTSIFLLVASMMLFACSSPRYMYSPSAQNVPVLVKQGDSKLAVNYSPDLNRGIFADNSNDEYYHERAGFDLQGAVAVTNNFAIQLNYFNRTERDSDLGYNGSDNVVKYKRNLTEIGIGYFKSISTRDKVFFQVFGGAGKGNFSFTDKGRDTGSLFYERSHRADVFKFYLQPAIIFRPRENFSLIVSTRLSFVNYGNIKTDYTPDELSYFELNRLSEGTVSFWEPCFTNNFGFKKLPGVRFEYQLGFCTLMSEKVIAYRGTNFSVGVGLDIPGLFRGNPKGD